MINRAELIANLKQVEPALSSKEFVPIFTCFCFDGATVTAYDDIVALQAPCGINIKGGLRGRLLLDFFEASKATNVEISQDGRDVHIKAGRSKLDTTAFPEEDFIFQFPKGEDAEVIDIDEAFTEALGKALVSMGTDPSHQWRMGVTTIFDSRGIIFYSTDNKSASKVWVDFDKERDIPERVTVLPPRFCELVVDLGKKNGAHKLVLTETWAECKFKSGLRLFSKTIQQAAPDQYDAIFTEQAGKKVRQQLIDIPAGLDRCLERSEVVIGYNTDDPKMTLKVEEGKLNFYTKSPVGDVRDTIKLEGHPDIEVDCLPSLIKRVLPQVNRFLVTEGCVVLAGEKFVHLVTTIVS